MIYILKTRDNYDKQTDESESEFSTFSWDDVIKKPFKIMLTKRLADEFGWSLSYDGCWWIDVDLTEQKENDKK